MAPRSEKMKHSSSWQAKSPPHRIATTSRRSSHPARIIRRVSFLDDIDRDAFNETLANARQRLLAERNAHGWWTGELSSSALSTATAIVALSLAKRNGCEAAGDAQPVIDAGLQWLIENQNDDGGFGDTDKSFSNISTTMLCWAAFATCGFARPHDSHTDDTYHASLTRCETWLAQHAGSLAVPDLVAAVMKRYGKDRTFSVPILTMCALSGRLDDPKSRDAWRWVKQLPFELAALPQRWFRLVNMQVVSYALPALIAIGLVRHRHRPTWNPLARLFRAAVTSRVMRRLESIQPSTGGFLEATPLTSFVTMSLAACGFARHPVVTHGVRFLKDSARPDGSWPIDTNLATWVTTLSVNALSAGRKLHEHLDADERRRIRDWLLGQQYTEVHPYTGAAPGGWAWTDLPGGVPDADDTSGAVVALVNLSRGDDEATVHAAAQSGANWLRGLINRDGGMPTFCRGWGRLPFDRSSTDITAHALRAFFAAFYDEFSNPEEGVIFDEIPAYQLVADDRVCIAFLRAQQRDDGAWLPLWFGNQHEHDDENATYGTSRVLAGLARQANDRDVSSLADRATQWVLAHQQSSGGWGGGPKSPCSIEETALAVEALGTVEWAARFGGEGEGAMKARAGDEGGDVNHRDERAKPQAAIARGVDWLVEHTDRGRSFPPSPIGFYFAKLWYYEKLYPIIFTVAALERVAAMIESGERRDM